MTDRPHPPAPPSFALEVEPYLDVVVVRVHGTLDAGAADQLDACLASLWDVGLRHLHLDLADLGAVCDDGRRIVERWSSRAVAVSPATALRP